MFGSSVLDTAIGLVFVFFVVSTVCSNIYTLISRYFNTRGELLSKTLFKLLSQELYDEVMNHPLIRDNHLKQKLSIRFWKNELEYETKPDYIDPRVFAEVLAEYIEKASRMTDEAKKYPALSKPIEYFIDQTRQKLHGVQQRLPIDEFQTLVHEIAEWYDERMNALKRIFKSQSQVWIGLIATGVVLFFNINTITIGKILWQQDTIRDAVVSAAEAQAQIEPSNDDSIENPVKTVEDNLAAFGLPIGWTEQELEAIGLPEPIARFKLLKQVDNPERPIPNLATSFFGWIISIGAAVVGAPFWFDVIRQIVNFRRG